MNQAVAKPSPMLLSPSDHTLIMIDFQSQMAFATKSIDSVVLRNNTALVANAAKIFNVSVIPTTVAEKTFSGPMFEEIKAAFPRAKFFERTTMNAWEDKAVIEEVNRLGKAFDQRGAVCAVSFLDLNSTGVYDAHDSSPGVGV